MVNPEPITENSDAAGSGKSGCFEVQISLAGMDPANVLDLILPAKLSGATVSQLLEHAFPSGEDGQRAVASMFDLRSNPDLPDIYAVFRDAFAESRKGRCTLSFTGGDGLDLDLSGLVSQQLGASGQSAVSRLTIQIKQRYRVIEDATQSGFWGSKEGLLAWLQSLTVLYFLDKHKVEIPAPLPCGAGPGFTAAVADLESKDLITCHQDTQTFGITEEGRVFIGRLLSETESYIDAYDHFKDTGFDLNGDTLDPSSVEFDTGRGVDLRVHMFEAEGLDPVRTVFLLRLYDGTLDDFVPSWQGLLDDESFFDGILEPVVNRFEVDQAAIGQILESGYVLLEERADRARELESQQEIIGRVWA